MTGAGASTGTGSGSAVSSSSCRRLWARSGGLTHAGHAALRLELVAEDVREWRREIGSKMVWRKDCLKRFGAGGPTSAVSCALCHGLYKFGQ